MHGPLRLLALGGQAIHDGAIISLLEALGNGLQSSSLLLLRNCRFALAISHTVERAQDLRRVEDHAVKPEEMVVAHRLESLCRPVEVPALLMA